MVGNEDDAKICHQCKTDFDGDKIIGCEGKCSGWFHLKCAGIKDKDFTVINQYHELKWFCEECRQDNFEVNIIKKLLGKELTIMRNEMKEMKDMIKNLAKNEQDVKYEKTYATVVTQPAILIKPKISQESAKTTEDIKKKIDPSKLKVGVTKINKIRDGGVAVQCNSKEDVEKFKTIAEKELGNSYDIKKAKQHTPEIKVLGIRENLSNEEIKNCIISQNDIIDQNSCKIEISYIRKITNNHYNATAEVDSATFEKVMKTGKLNVGWTRCTVKENLKMWRCYKCAGFYHKAAECKNKLACWTCAGEHESRNCNEENQQCINCITTNKVLKLKLDTNHRAADQNCPVYKRKIGSLKNKVDYA